MLFKHLAIRLASLLKILHLVSGYVLCGAMYNLLQHIRFVREFPSLAGGHCEEDLVGGGGF